MDTYNNWQICKFLSPVIIAFSEIENKSFFVLSREYENNDRITVIDIRDSENLNQKNTKVRVNVFAIMNGS